MIDTWTGSTALEPGHANRNRQNLTDLQQRVGVLQEPASHGVTRLMVRHRLLLLRLQNLGLLLQTSRRQEGYRTGTKT